MRARRFCLTSLLGLFGLVATGCKSEVVLGIATDLSAPGLLDRVLLEVQREGVPLLQQEWDVPGIPGGEFRLPGSVGVYARYGAEPRVEVIVTGFKGNAPIVERRSIFSLVSQQTRFTRLTLVDACRNLQCDTGESCVEGRCQPELVLSARFPPYETRMEERILCDSGFRYLDTATGQPLPIVGACDGADFCQEGTCYRILPEDPPLAFAWQALDTGTGVNLNAVWATPEGESFAVGDGGTILHLPLGVAPGGASGFVPEVSGTSEHLFGVWGASADEIWAVGANGSILQRSGGTWSLLRSAPGAGEQLRAITGVVGGSTGLQLWAVGSRGKQALLLHSFGGIEWFEETIPTGGEELRAIYAVSESEVWAVGRKGQVLHRGADGTWMRGPSVVPPGADPGAHDLNGLWGQSGLLFLVGRGGIYRLSPDGTELVPEEVSSSASAELFGIWGTASGPLSAVGDEATILRRNQDGVWLREPTDPALRDKRLHGVFGDASGKQLFAVADQGRIFVTTRPPVAPSDGGTGLDGGAGDGGAVDGGSPDGCPSLCAPTSLCCAGSCVQPGFDPANCGACGQACALDQVCLAGSCVPGSYLDLASGWALSNDIGDSTASSPTVTLDASSRLSAQVSAVGNGLIPCTCNAQTLQLALSQSLTCGATLHFDYSSTGGASGFNSLNASSLLIELTQQGSPVGELYASTQSGTLSCGLYFDASYPSPPLLRNGHNAFDLSALVFGESGSCSGGFDAVSLHLQASGCSTADMSASRIANVFFLP